MRRRSFTFLQERSGNVALMFALCLPVLVLGAGGVVDLVNIVSWKSQLQDAADAAAMATVARNSPAYQAALTMTSDGAVTGANLTAPAQQMFNADLNAPIKNSGASFEADVQKAGFQVNSTVTGKVTFTTGFLSLIGLRSVPITVTSHASDSIPTYIDFYLLLDNSPSMGLGATQTDINTLVAQTGCAFACHATSQASEDFYTKAKALGVTMRIDVVRQATQQLTTTANLKAVEDGVPNEFRMAVYDFGTAAYISPALSQVGALSSDLTGQIKTSAGTVDLMTVPSNNNAVDGPNNDEDTNFDYAFSNLSKTMVPSGQAGTGASAAAPQKVLFFVTDGMVDMGNGGSRTMGGISNGTCQSLKAKGIKIAILYTTYLPSSIASDAWSQANVAPLLPQVAPALQNCASPGLFSEVGPNQGIPDAMAALFKTIVSSARFTG